MTPGEPVSDEQIRLLRLLCEDLLPNEVFSVDRLPALIDEIARADSKWNRRVQMAIDEFYALRESGKNAEAQERRQEFLGACPSKWYRQIVDAL